MVKITPETFIEIQKELDEEDCQVVIDIPTQEEIDAWLKWSEEEKV